MSVETLPSAFQGSIKATNSRKTSLDPLPWRKVVIPVPWPMQRPRSVSKSPPQAPETRVKQNQGNRIFNVWKNQCQQGWGSPDQMESQPVYDKGLKGCSSQCQVELETLSGGRAPHAVGSQGQEKGLNFHPTPSLPCHK